MVKVLRTKSVGRRLGDVWSDTDSKPRFGVTLRITLGQYATVCCVEPKANVELRDLYEHTTIKEVNTVVDRALEWSTEGRVLWVNAKYRWQKTAMATLPYDNAEALLAKGHSRIRWVSCRIRPEGACSLGVSMSRIRSRSGELQLPWPYQVVLQTLI